MVRTSKIANKSKLSPISLADETQMEKNLANSFFNPFREAKVRYGNDWIERKWFMQIISLKTKKNDLLKLVKTHW